MFGRERRGDQLSRKTTALKVTFQSKKVHSSVVHVCVCVGPASSKPIMPIPSELKELAAWLAKQTPSQLSLHEKGKKRFNLNRSGDGQGKYLPNATFLFQELMEGKTGICL